MFVDFFIKRPIFATVCALLIILGGAVCIPTLPIAQFPTLAPPTVQVGLAAPATTNRPPTVQAGLKAPATINSIRSCVHCGICLPVCPTYRALTPVGRLQAMEQRLDAMLHAVQTVQPALEKFYASLGDEQKERFNRLSPAQG